VTDLPIPFTAAEPAPDFTLIDTSGRDASLSDFHGRNHVVLVFNRGFT
jgi:peroxiredoxin